jgi:cytochrome c556
MSFSRIAGAVAGLSVLAVAGASLALDATAVEKARHDYFHSIGKSFKAIREELLKPEPSVADLKTYAAAIDAVAPKLPSQFPAGSGPSTGIKTAVKAEVWTRAAEFKKDAADFATAAHALNLAAQKGDLAAIGAAQKTMGGTCKTCHETFKARDDH